MAASVTLIVGVPTFTTAVPGRYPLAVAEICDDPAGPCGVTRKVTVVLFCSTVTEAGTVATDGVKLDRLITCPPAGAAALTVNVIVPGEFANKAIGLGDSVMVLEIAVIVTVDGTLLANTSLTISCTT